MPAANRSALSMIRTTRGTEAIKAQLALSVKSGGPFLFKNDVYVGARTHTKLAGGHCNGLVTTATAKPPDLSGRGEEVSRCTWNAETVSSILTA